MFKSISTNFDISSYLNKIIFNNHIECINFNIFNKKGISLSGSFILELYNIISSDKNIINSNDMDIYIELDKVSISYLEELFMKLFISGYRLYQKKNQSSKLYKNYNNIVFELYKLYNPKYCQDCIDCNNSQTNKYFSLSKFIYNIITLENIFSGQKIDIIFTKCTIRKLINESFDFDIIKNFVTLNKLYFYNKDAIDNRIATMTSTHFKNRVISNIYELNNFILRYEKYTNRGFKIFIDNNEITKIFINKIINIVLYVLNININKPNYILSKLYICKNTSSLLYSYYIKYFYINEQLMQAVYHPDNIHRLLDMNINLDDI